MMHSLATEYAKNYCNRTLIVQVIIESDFSETQCVVYAHVEQRELVGENFVNPLLFYYEML